MNAITFAEQNKRIHAQITLPASKSISNRLLILNAIEPSIILEDLSEADDTVLMKQALTSQQKIIDLKNAGTCVRFLMAYFAATGRHKIITGNQRMQSRPVKPLIDALINMGAHIQYLEKDGYLPVEIFPSELTGGEIYLDTSNSSQFASALLLISPLLQKDLVLQLTGNVASYPYISMTIKLLMQCGIDVIHDGNTILIKHGQKLKAGRYKPEADWSAASYWYEVAALSNSSEIYLAGLTEHSIQGDAIIKNWMLDFFGIQTRFDKQGAWIKKQSNTSMTNEINLNMQDYPDLAPAICVIICAMGRQSRLSGLQTLALKESNRLHALADELGKTGVQIYVSENNCLQIDSSKLSHDLELNLQTYADHRMAMAFAPLALCYKKIMLDDIFCVNKSYPKFWEHLKQAGFSLNN